jgi:hypothetical protein
MYFAKDAGFVDNGYAYTFNDIRKILLVKISLGECKERLKDKSLERPDLKDNSKFRYNSHKG